MQAQAIQEPCYACKSNYRRQLKPPGLPKCRLDREGYDRLWAIPKTVAVGRYHTETGTCPVQGLCRWPGGTTPVRSSSGRNRPCDIGNEHDPAQRSLAPCNRSRCVDGMEVYELQASSQQDCHRPIRSRRARSPAPLLHLHDLELPRKDLDSWKARCFHADPGNRPIAPYPFGSVKAVRETIFANIFIAQNAAQKRCPVDP